MMYQIETHLHVSEVSPCARLTAAEMIRLYAKAGYSTVMVTDHCKKIFFDKLGELPWSEKTARFFDGCRAARAAGEACGVTVLFAAELAFPNSPNHYLAYGISEEFMNKYPDFLDHGIEGFYPLAKACGMLVIQAHPYRDGVCFPTPDHVDGVEVYNSNPRHEDYSDRTAILAKERNLLITAGSDAHRAEDVAQSGIVSEHPITDINGFAALIRSGSAQIIRR